MRGLIQAAAIALLVTSVPAAAKPAAPANVAAAVAAPGRTPANVELDAGRKPAELLKFLGLKEGMRVIDMFGGNLYWAEIMAPAVGPKGQVIIWNPTQFTNAKRLAAFAAFNAKTPNVWFISSPFETPDLAPGRYDFMLMNLDYHDVYWQSTERKISRMEPDVWLKALYAAMKEVQYLPSVKVAFESPRFWETDDYLYGGLAWTDRLNENIIYPSDNFHHPNGILVAAYVAGWTNQGNPQKFAVLSDAERLRVSRESIEALHPGKSHLLTKGVSVGWGLVPWSEGVGAIGPNWGPGDRGARYAEMLKPEGPIVFAGEHLSYAGLWQEGAALSAHEAMKLVQAMAAERAVAA